MSSKRRKKPEPKPIQPAADIQSDSGRIPEVVLHGEGLLGISPTFKQAEKFTSAGIETVKLGRRRPDSVPEALPFRLYWSAERMSAPPPAVVDYYTKAKASMDRMYMNDRYGCCVVSGKYHAVGAVSAHDQPGEVIVGTDDEVVRMYQTICGPGDRGCIVTDVLNYAKLKGLPFNGTIRKIDGYVRGNPRNKLEVQVGTYLFGAPTIAFMLPSDWPGKAVWDVSSAQIVGGHDVTIVGYNEQGIQVSSWGRIYTMTWAALTSGRYVEELYYVLYPEWYGADNLSPLGLDVTKLRADLAKLGGGQVPDITTDPPNPPEPPTPGQSMRVAASLWLDFPSNRPGTVASRVIGSAKVVGPVPASYTDGPVSVNLEGLELATASDLSAFSAPLARGESIQAAGGIPAGLPFPLVLLIAEYGFKVLPTILSGLREGKSVRQIIRDVLASVLTD